MANIKLVTNVFGAFALKNGKVIEKFPFPKDPKDIAERLETAETGVCEEELKLLKRLKDTKTEIVLVDNPNRFRGLGLDVEFLEDKEFTNIAVIAEHLGIQKQEVNEIITAVNHELTKRKMRVPERDQLVMQAISTMDEVEDVVNKMTERLREWYGLHFPELALVIQNPDLYARIVSERGRRENITGLKNIDPGSMNSIEDYKKDSIGFELSDSDEKALKSLASTIVKLTETKAQTEAYIDSLMQDVAPNTRELAGPLLAARLILIAGGLKRLSQMPASTIQILGAEDAFFNFLRTKRDPPKHGVIFQLPEIRSAGKPVRGKLARTFAAKFAIAAKADYFRGGFIGKKLRDDFLKRVQMLKR